jgi:uncharacterized protein YfbU (UPF0304 family)
MIMSERFELRLPEETLTAIDGWRVGQDGAPSRSEAIRQLIERGLAGTDDEPMHFSPGEKLAVLMLCDIYRALQAESKLLKVHGKFDPELLKEIVGSGHLWALRQEYSWAFNRDQDDPEIVAEVFDILDMWVLLEEGFEALKPAARARLPKEANYSEPKLRFWGFDGNHERQYHIARFVVEKLKRYEKFADRDINSHTRLVDQYRRMLAVFNKIKPTIAGKKDLTADQIIEILAARHPPGPRRGVLSGG